MSKKTKEVPYKVKNELGEIAPRDKIQIYTRRYAPFRCGGDLTEYIRTTIYEPDIVMLAETKLGTPVGFWVLTHEDLNWTFCISQTCGAIVGGDKDMGVAIASVINDIRTADEHVLMKQFAQGLKDRETALEMSAQDFWHHHRHLADK